MFNEKPPHINWLNDTGERLTTKDGKEVEIWEFRYQDDKEVFSAWAKHFRNHYCEDEIIDLLRGNLSRKDYLENRKFPSKCNRLGVSVRKGDFGEILVADFVQWLKSFWVPRLRWDLKVNRNTSTLGCDVIGFIYDTLQNDRSNNKMMVIETKTRFTKNSLNGLQTAVEASSKDALRIDESLNYLRQRLIYEDSLTDAEIIERFQNPTDHPYEEFSGAALVVTKDFFQAEEIPTVDTERIPVSKKASDFKPHPNRDNLRLYVIKGSRMMDLLNRLYEVAANEA